MNSIRHPILQLIFNSRSAQQKHILLDQLGRLVQRLSATVDGGRRPFVDPRPLFVFRFWNIAESEAERAEAVCRVVLYHPISLRSAQGGRQQVKHL